MKIKNVLGYLLLSIPFWGCSVLSMEDVLAKDPHLRWTGKPTGLSEKLNITGCYDMSSIYQCMHFEEDGTVYGDVGNSIGVYKLVGDTIKMQLYKRSGFLKNWARRHFDFLILNKDSLMYFDEQYVSSDGRIDMPASLRERFTFTHYDCPPNFNPTTVWPRDKKWMWEREEDWKQWMEEYKRNKKK